MGFSIALLLSLLYLISEFTSVPIAMTMVVAVGEPFFYLCCLFFFCFNLKRSLVKGV